MKIWNLLLPLALTVAVSCGEATPKEENTETNKKEEACVLKYNYLTSEIGFGGFKTTERKEVKGKFDSFKVENTSEASTPSDVLKNATVSIDVNSLNTGDPIRDPKLKSIFFGNMMNTASIEGSVKNINLDSNQVTINIKMNDVAADVILSYKESGDTVMMEGLIDLMSFEAQPAVDSLSVACYDLHKGADGESKTWSEAKVYIKTILDNSCR